MCGFGSTGPVGAASNKPGTSCRSDDPVLSSGASRPCFVQNWSMAPAEHLAWFTDNTDWFGALAVDDLDTAVPACPGWTVESVINHLTFGLGRGYPHALRAATDCAEDRVFVDLEIPTTMPTGADALSVFNHTMRDCLAVFARTDPTTLCCPQSRSWLVRRRFGIRGLGRRIGWFGAR